MQLSMDEIAAVDAAVPREAVPLRLVVRVNSGIRQVIAISRRVNLVAVNAMLAAKQAGSQARGFGVVSAELRAFSSQLSQQMQDLDGLIYELVHGVAEAAHIGRRQRYMDDTRRCDIAAPHLAAAAAHLEQCLGAIEGAGNDRWTGLRSRLDRALRLCGTGIALSRAAKIEAVYGGVLAGGLRQVADEIEVAILDILGTLKQLRHDVGA
jgi:hypothetical protein